MTPVRAGVIVGMALLALACAPPQTDRSPDRLHGAALSGSWGGEHVALQLSARGGSVEYDCAYGSLDSPLVPDSSGAFSVAGRHVREHGGPVHLGEELPSLPALYVGRVFDDRMQLRVRVGADTLGPFTLRRGAQAQLLKCL